MRLQQSVLLYVIILVSVDHAHIRAVTPAVGLGARLLCRRVPGFTPRQRRLCSRAPDAMVAVSQGAKLGIKECQRLFSRHRWNCTLPTSTSALSHVVLVGSREAAFTYAISSAGVTYSVTAACARGNISTCGCDHRKRNTYSAGGWKWGGCSADIRYGVKFSRRFVDARESEGDARALMNLHNNNAGRRAVRKTLRTECKCHGVSGSCTMKTCWVTLPPFKAVGKNLLTKYRRAKQVDFHTSRRRSSPYLRLRRGKRRARRPRRSQLVYLSPSPSYCTADHATGALGTYGRTCNRTSTGMGGCDVLCCGRGYNTHQYMKQWQCNCKFFWCCYVTCHTCREEAEMHTCK